MKRRAILAKAAIMAAAVSTSVGASPASAQVLSPGCVAGPLYAPYASDFGLVLRARMICGVFGNKPHTVKIEVWGPRGKYAVNTETWFPGSGFWEVETGIWNLYWGKPGLPSAFNSCVTVYPYDGNSWFKRCIKAESYRHPNLSLSFIRGREVETHQLK